MDYTNKDRTITISGIEFDIPQKENLSKWDYKNPDKKTTELWLSAYIKNGSAYECHQYNLTKGSHNKITLDGKSLKGDDKEKAEYIFGSVLK